MANIQTRLSGIRPPRVQIFYEIETGGAMEKKELPFVFGIIADLSGNKETENDTQIKFQSVDKDNFNEFIKNIKPTLNMLIQTYKSTEKVEIKLEISAIDDFKPGNIANIEFLQKKIIALRRLHNLYNKLETDKTLLNSIVGVLGDPSKTSQEKPAEASKNQSAPGQGTSTNNPQQPNNTTSQQQNTTNPQPTTQNKDQKK